VLLPAAEFLGGEHRAPGRELVDAGALVVLATGANPGAAPALSMAVVIGPAVRLYGLSTLEALAAATLNGAWTWASKRTVARATRAIAIIGGELAYIETTLESGERAVRRTSVVAMANAHSHAFQIGLPGAGERPHPDEDFRSRRNEMYRLAGSLDPDSVRAAGKRVCKQMGGGRLRRGRRVSLRRAPPRRDPVRGIDRDRYRTRGGGDRVRARGRVTSRRLPPRRFWASAR
jgi:hypothetical protein